MGNNYSVQAPMAPKTDAYKNLLEFKKPQFSFDSKATVPMARPKEFQPKTSNFYGLEVETELVKEVKSEKLENSEVFKNTKFKNTNIRTVTLKNGMSVEYWDNLDSSKEAKPKIYRDEEGFTTFENIPNRIDIGIDGTDGDDKIALKNSNPFFVYMKSGNDVIKVENSSADFIYSFEKLTLVDGAKDKTKAPSLKDTDIRCDNLTNNLLWTENVKTEKYK